MNNITASSEAEDYSDKIVVERPARHVALIRFDRLDKKNAFHSSMIVELGRVLAELNSDDTVRSVVLTGGETCFAAGADIKEMVAFGPAKVANAPARVAAWQAIEQFEKPLIAAVNGMAFGAGCELALLCDFIVAGSNALFGQPEVKIGGMPGDGGSQRPSRKLPPNVASYMLMTGDPISADQAMRFGLVLEIQKPSESIVRAVYDCLIHCGTCASGHPCHKGVRRNSRGSHSRKRSRLRARGDHGTDRNGRLKRGNARFRRETSAKLRRAVVSRSGNELER